MSREDLQALLQTAIDENKITVNDAETVTKFAEFLQDWGRPDEPADTVERLESRLKWIADAERCAFLGINDEKERAKIVRKYENRLAELRGQ